MYESNAQTSEAEDIYGRYFLMRTSLCLIHLLLQLSFYVYMTTPDSSISADESSMDHTSNHEKSLTTTGESEEESGDGELWEAFNQRFRQVQTVLDRNRALIQQVNENHQSRIPDNMVKNVALIQEINGNISKVVSLYSGLSSNFSTFFHQRAAKTGTDDRTPSPQA